MYMMFFGKNTGIYTVFQHVARHIFPCQRHKNTVNYSVLALGRLKKIGKSAKKYLFFPYPDPEKRENTTSLKDFGGSAPG